MSEFNLKIECVALWNRLRKRVAHRLGVKEVFVVRAEHEKIACLKCHTNLRETDTVD